MTSENRMLAGKKIGENSALLDEKGTGEATIKPKAFEFSFRFADFWGISHRNGSHPVFIYSSFLKSLMIPDCLAVLKTIKFCEPWHSSHATINLSGCSQIVTERCSITLV